jgi:hypothetical protein
MSLVLKGKLMSLVLKGKLREMVDLGENIQRKVGLPDPNFITLI